MKTTSLRGGLIKMLFPSIVLGVLFVGGASCYSTYHEATEVYDAEQVHFARTLHTLAQQIGQAKTINIEGITRQNAYEKYLTFRVWRQGNLVLQSNNARDFGPMTQTVGFTDRMIGETHWRVYVEEKEDIRVEVAEENEVRLDLVRHIIAGIFLPQLIILPIIAIIIWVGITRGLEPIKRLSALVRHRNPNELAPIANDHAPDELLPMVDAINDLMQRVTDARRIEMNFTNYAAHEMRTPIAALKTQAQVILRTADPARQKELAGELLATVSRTQRIIEQLLTYARVQHNAVTLAPVSLSSVVLDEIRHAIPQALEKHIALEHHIAENITITAQEDLLRLVIANLLDNAIKYIPAQGRIAITLENGKEGSVLQIRDNGPGIPATDLPHIYDPFYRVTGAGAPGSGLGLTIVKWACELQRILLRTTPGLDEHGVGFTLHFPVV